MSKKQKQRKIKKIGGRKERERKEGDKKEKGRG